MKHLIKFTFHVALVSALLIGADILLPDNKEVAPGKIVKIIKKVPYKVESKRKVFVVNKVILVEKTCTNGKCNKRVRINRTTKTN